MELMKWSSHYEIGVEMIDQHHEHLFMLVNKFYKAMLQGDGRKAVDDALKELLEYTVYHFDAEEKYMQSINYSNIEDHKKEHKVLLQKAQGMVDRYRAGEEEVSMLMVHFLKDWLINHTSTTDRKITRS